MISIKIKRIASFTLPSFGGIDVTFLQEYYATEINFGGNKVALDLNFEYDRIVVRRLEKVKEFIDNLTQYHSNNKTAIDQDYNNEGCDTTKTHVGWHLKELDEDYLSELINFDDTSSAPEYSF